MRRPFRDSCTLQLLNFTSPEPHIANKAFWRSCSFLLGAVLQASFKPEAGLFLHSFPKPNSTYSRERNDFFERVEILFRFLICS